MYEKCIFSHSLTKTVFHMCSDPGGEAIKAINNAGENMHVLRAQLYKMGKKYDTIVHEHNTTTQPQHTTTNMSHCRPTLQRLWPSPSMGRAVAPLNHGAAAPQHHAQAASRRACIRCCWFARLDGRKQRDRNKERGAGSWP